MVRERSRVLGRKCSFSLVEMITESRVDQRSTCRYERNLWKHEENLSLSNSLDIVRANTRPRSRNWNNICGDNIRNPLRDISHELKLDIQLTSRRCTRVAVFFIPLDFIMNVEESRGGVAGFEKRVKSADVRERIPSLVKSLWCSEWRFRDGTTSIDAPLTTFSDSNVQSVSPCATLLEPSSSVIW